MPGPAYLLIHVFGTVRDELDREDKDRISHRGVAFRALVRELSGLDGLTRSEPS